MVLMGIAALKEGDTNDRIGIGRNRLETPAPFISRRVADERFNRQAAAENIVAKVQIFTGGRKHRSIFQA
jgi:hypothetical protein